VDKPKVIVFIDWYLPGYKAGGPVRSLANLVDHLRDRIDFHIVTRNTDYTEEIPYTGIEADCWLSLPGGERVWYASAEGMRRSAWKKLLAEQGWDAIYINGIYSWWFNILPLWLSLRGPVRRVVAVRGMLASGALRQGSLKKLVFLSFARMLDLYTDVRFQATNTEEERDIRMHISRQAEVRVVPNLSRKAIAEAVHITKEIGRVRLVSVARIAAEKNTLLAIQSLKNVKGAVRFDLYGPIYDEAYWAQCQAAISQLPPHVKVEYHGTVTPEEVPAVLADHHALFMPSAGENFGHTMLESLTAGRPLLISDRTPWRELEQQHAGWDLPLDRLEGFTEVVDRVCEMDQAAYDTWSKGAFDLGTRYLADATPIEASLKLFQP